MRYLITAILFATISSGASAQQQADEKSTKQQVTLKITSCGKAALAESKKFQMVTIATVCRAQLVGTRRQAIMTITTSGIKEIWVVVDSRPHMGFSPNGIERYKLDLQLAGGDQNDRFEALVTLDRSTGATLKIEGNPAGANAFAATNFRAVK